MHSKLKMKSDRLFCEQMFFHVASKEDILLVLLFASCAVLHLFFLPEVIGARDKRRLVSELRNVMCMCWLFC